MTTAAKIRVICYESTHCEAVIQVLMLSKLCLKKSNIPGPLLCRTLFAHQFARPSVVAFLDVLPATVDCSSMNSGQGLGREHVKRTADGRVGL